MGLKDYVVPRTDITLAPGNIMPVRGLGFADISKLVVEHGPALILIYGKVWDQAQEGTLDAEAVGKLVQTTLVEMPELAAQIIALGADDPDAVSNAMKLPMVTQADALMAIISHTFVSEAEVKKLVEIVTKAMERTADLAGALTTGAPSKDGSGESVAE